MKKILLIVLAILIFTPKCYAESETIAILTKKGFFDKTPVSTTRPYDEVKKLLSDHLKYSNAYDFDKLKSLYADNYVSADGFSKDIYFDLIKKTWAGYPDIKYKAEVTDIELFDNAAIAEIYEEALATTGAKSDIVTKKGLLKSTSGSIYYLENIGGKWQIVSDHITFEKTSLSYGDARLLNVDLVSPNQIAANTGYTASLNICNIPKDTLIIASVGKENTTYPQKEAEEVFRKFPDSGVLERVFTSNGENVNEYTVASYGLTKAQIEKGSEIKIYITGLGFAMSRVNVIPKNNFIKVENDEKNK